MIIFFYLIIDEVLVKLQLIGTVLLVFLPVVFVLFGVIRHPLLLLHLVHLAQAPAVVVHLPTCQKKSDTKAPPGENGQKQSNRGVLRPPVEAISCKNMVKHHLQGCSSENQN